MFEIFYDRWNDDLYFREKNLKEENGYSQGKFTEYEANKIAKNVLELNDAVLLADQISIDDQCTIGILLTKLVVIA